MKNTKKILIVCTGNSCRSIMAEGYLTKMLNDKGINNISVASFGTGAVPGLKPTSEAVQLMKEYEIDISGYISSSLDKVHIKEADIILAMERHHRKRIVELVPEAKEKTHLLGEFSLKHRGKIEAIEDPIGYPIEKYRIIFETIKDCVEGFLKIGELSRWTKE